MRAMALTGFALGHLDAVEMDTPPPGPGDVLVKVLACGVCRTDLHVVDGELAEPAIPIVPGHEIVGRVEAVGHGVTTCAPGDRVGIPWLGWSCGTCDFCRDRAREPVPARAFTRDTRSTVDTRNTRAPMPHSAFRFPPVTTTST